jgi:hypothetical protein
MKIGVGLPTALPSSFQSSQGDPSSSTKIEGSMRPTPASCRRGAPLSVQGPSGSGAVAVPIESCPSEARAV